MQLSVGLGGSFPPDEAAGFLWIGWQLSSGLGGRNHRNKQGVCYLAVKEGRHHYTLMRIYQYTIDAQDKRDMRRLHPDVLFDWKKITRQLVEKREVCRRYRSRRRTPRLPRTREPLYGVYEPQTRRVYVNDPDNIAGVGALLDALIAGGLPGGQGSLEP